MITIVDYGVGNIQALLNMFDHLGIDAQDSADPDVISNAQKLLLPGVGAFDKAMAALKTRKLIDALEYAVNRQGVPLLGICLGMQLLARKSAEGNLPGLGWLAADVQRIEAPPGSAIKIPHMGWSDINPCQPSPLFSTATEPERFYFVHSYHMVCDDPTDVLATVDYGATLCCAVRKRNIWGVQFHPEKSHRFGMKLLTAFSRLPPNGIGTVNSFI